MVEKTEIGKVTTNGVTMAGKISILKKNDQIVMLIKKFLSSLNYTGISNLDFIYSKGKLYFLEVNFRYAAWGYGVSRMGINFPQLFIEAISGNDIHMNITNMEGSCHFFNEKIGAINVIEKSLKISKYRNLKNTSDCCMVYCKDDPHPYIAFVIIYFLKLIKSRLKLYCHL